MAKKLYVGNLSYSVTQEQLENLFAQAGEVTEASIITDRDSGRSKGFGFVEMSTEEEAQEAISKFNGYSLDNRTLTVNEARPREERPRNRDNRDSYGGGSGGGNRRNSYSDRERSGGSRRDRF